MARFEVVTKYLNSKINLIPTCKTEQSAGYNFYVANNIVIPSWENLQTNYLNNWENGEPFTLDEIKKIMKKYGVRPSLVSSGVKCYLDEGTYLELSVRSSTPLNAGLVLANGVGIIDADYADNPDNEGEIFFQLINLTPFDIILRAGDCIGQGIIKPYLHAENGRILAEQRKGGFGSTNV